MAQHFQKEATDHPTAHIMAIHPDNQQKQEEEEEDILLNSSLMLFCTLCQREFFNAPEHMAGKRHRKNFQLLSEKEDDHADCKKNKFATGGVLNFIVPSSSSSQSNALLRMESPNDSAAHQAAANGPYDHDNNEKEKKAAAVKEESAITPLPSSFSCCPSSITLPIAKLYICQLCHAEIVGRKNTQQHLLGKVHQKNWERYCQLSSLPVSSSTYPQHEKTGIRRSAEDDAATTKHNFKNEKGEIQGGVKKDAAGAPDEDQRQSNGIEFMTFVDPLPLEHHPSPAAALLSSRRKNQNRRHKKNNQEGLCRNLVPLKPSVENEGEKTRTQKTKKLVPQLSDDDEDEMDIVAVVTRERTAVVKKEQRSDEEIRKEHEAVRTFPPSSLSPPAATTTTNPGEEKKEEKKFTSRKNLPNDNIEGGDTINNNRLTKENLARIGTISTPMVASVVVKPPKIIHAKNERILLESAAMLRQQEKNQKRNHWNNDDDDPSVDERGHTPITVHPIATYADHHQGYDPLIGAGFWGEESLFGRSLDSTTTPRPVASASSISISHLLDGGAPQQGPISKTTARGGGKQWDGMEVPSFSTPAKVTDEKGHSTATTVSTTTMRSVSASAIMPKLQIPPPRLPAKYTADILKRSHHQPQEVPTDSSTALESSRSNVTRATSVLEPGELRVPSEAPTGAEVPGEQWASM